MTEGQGYAEDEQSIEIIYFNGHQDEISNFQQSFGLNLRCLYFSNFWEYSHPHQTHHNLYCIAMLSFGFINIEVNVLVI